MLSRVEYYCVGFTSLLYSNARENNKTSPADHSEHMFNGNWKFISSNRNCVYGRWIKYNKTQTTERCRDFRFVFYSSTENDSFHWNACNARRDTQTKGELAGEWNIWVWWGCVEYVLSIGWAVSEKVCDILFSGFLNLSKFNFISWNEKMNKERKTK